MKKTIIIGIVLIIIGFFVYQINNNLEKNENEKLTAVIRNQDMEEENTTIEEYKDEAMELQYPSTWVIEKENGEDGSVVKFLDENRETVMWIERGEAWRVDLSVDEESYKEVLLQSYPEVEILEFEQTKIGGEQARKIVFSHNNNEKIATKYSVIAGYIFLEINFENSMEHKKIIDSIKFVE